MKELYSEDPETVSSFLEDLGKDEQSYKKLWAARAKRSVAFANGDQSGSLDAGPVMYNGQPVTILHEGAPVGYQVNEIEPITRTIVSYMTRQKPTVEIFPASYDESDKAVARTSERLNEAKYDLDNEFKNSSDAAFWSVTTGTVFTKDYWDSSLGDYAVQIDEEGNEVLNPETGQPLISSVRTGMNNVAVLTGLSVSTDHSVTDFEEIPYIGDDYVMDVEWAREAFDIEGEGYFGNAKDIKADGYGSGTLSMLEEMKFAIPGGGYSSTSAGTRYKKDKCLISERYIRPNKKFPKGRYLIKAGGKLVYDSGVKGSPYFMELEQLMWHPYSMFYYEPYVGRLLGKSLVEQLVPIQININELWTAIIENSHTMAKPNIIAARNQLIKGQMNGKGANVYTYNIIPGAALPNVLQGAPLPSQFFNAIQSLVDQMVRIAGTNFVMQGQPPTGVSAASAINQLLENANTQHSDLMNRWEKFHEQRYTRKLRIIHRFMNHPNMALERYLKTLSKEVTDQEVKDFVGAQDLSDGVTLKIQAGSMIPKSEAARREMYKELGKEGILGNLAEDSPRGAKLRDEFLERLGEKPLATEESVEVRKARWENERIKRGEPAEISEFDIASIHLPCHKTLYQDPKFQESVSEEVKQALYAHIKEHEAAEAQKQQEQMMQQAQQQGMGAPNASQGAGGPPQGPEAPQNAPPPQGPPTPSPMMGPDMGAPQQEMPQEQLAA